MEWRRVEKARRGRGRCREGDAVVRVIRKVDDMVEHELGWASALVQRMQRERFDRLLALGLGALHCSTASQQQLALAVSLADGGGAEGIREMKLVDPLMTEEDVAIAEHYGMEVYRGPSAEIREPCFYCRSTNRAECGQATLPDAVAHTHSRAFHDFVRPRVPGEKTLLYMPHCSAKLYELLLHIYDMHGGLSRLHILGNRLERYAERVMDGLSSTSPSAAADGEWQQPRTRKHRLRQVTAGATPPLPPHPPSILLTRVEYLAAQRSIHPHCTVLPAALDTARSPWYAAFHGIAWQSLHPLSRPADHRLAGDEHATWHFGAAVTDSLGDWGDQLIYT
eukprot:ctg_2124.g540